MSVGADGPGDYRVFHRYDEAARRMLFFAREEAGVLGGGSIETEHLLLGLLRDPGGPTARVCAAARLSFDGVRSEVEKRFSAREPIPPDVEIPFARDAVRILVIAAEEADRLDDEHIGTEHLLLALLADTRSFAGSLLRDNGLGPDAVRAEIAAETSKRRAPHNPDMPDGLIPRFGRFLGRLLVLGSLLYAVGSVVRRLLASLHLRRANRPDGRPR